MHAFSAMRDGGFHLACATHNYRTGLTPIWFRSSLMTRTIPQWRRKWVAQALTRFGRIDAVVANAGIMIAKNVIEAEDADLDAMLAVNVKAPRRLAAAAWDALSESGRGRIIVLGSLSGKRVKSANASLYSVSKFAAVALAHGIRHTGWDLGIRATAVCPGFVATDMARSLTSRARQSDDQSRRHCPHHSNVARSSERGERRRIHHQLPIRRNLLNARSLCRSCSR